MENCVQRICEIGLFILIIAISVSCNDQEIEAVDIFDEEVLDTTRAVAFQLEGLGNVYVNEDRVQYEGEDVNIKGTVFTYSELGELLPVSSGDFRLSGKSNETFSSFEGYGISNIPDIGVLKELESTFDPGSYYSYATGDELKLINETAPLQDDRYYFSIDLESSLAADRVISIGNAAFQFEHFYLDPKDPSIFFQGDAKFSENIEIKDLGLGLSANGLLEFEPFTYSEELTALMVRPMETMHGNIYLTGLIPVKKYSIEIYGEAIIGFVLNDNGFVDFFEQGFENASYQMGVNGKVFVNNDLMEFLPSDPIEIGRATVVMNLEEGNNYMHVAGQVESTQIITEILASNGGEVVSELLAFQKSVSQGYFYIGDDIENTTFYFETTTFIEVPGIGSQELSKATIGVSATQVYAAGKMSMPGVGSVGLEGLIQFDGQFSLKGAAEVSVDLGVAELEASLSFTVNNDGVLVVASAGTCVIGDECVKVDVEVELNWADGSMRICADIPGLGRHCATVK